ncbi:AAA family ATPase [Inmirania thermothiophila]|uniref:MoxR-like ATPase n=1 Tax=Inmirania thermothiophila TaxID=1750597 RepID=A0A3N1XX90_9GAMM|nr:MoxR family ATPase [Inmirania thermothiophila]ROR29547.1 MoxR-like ATPase [Inmirania thermothiophila]
MRPAHLARILARELAAAAEGTHTPLMIWGPPGVGKSQLVAQAAAARGLPLIDLRLSQLEPSDLRGIPFRSGGRVEWAVPAMLPDAERHGPAGVLFLDEINAAPPVVSAAAYQLILDRRLGDYRVPEGWAILAAGNREGDRGVTFAMPAPLANRFAHLELEPHLDDWVAWAEQGGIDPRIIGFLRFRPDLLFAFDPEHSLTAFPTPRSWAFASAALAKFGDDEALLEAALAGCVGQAAAAELMAFLRLADALPDVDAIVRGEEVAVPEGLELQYALTAALAQRVRARLGEGDGEAAIGHALRYAARLPERELAVMLVADLQRAAGARLFAHPEFAPWAEAVADVLLPEG